FAASRGVCNRPTWNHAARLYDRFGMVARTRARYLAPIALAATLAGTYVVVQAALSTKHQTHANSARRTGAKSKYSQSKFYVVQQGDSLTSIATKTGVHVT